jgi:zinc protease
VPRRPGAVQTTIRLAGAAPSRTDPGYAAAALANLVFGGYFSSRWVSNIREDKGYTYSPHSGLEHPSAGSRFLAGADVATDVTAPALLETLYELGRIATVPVDQAELDQARRYAIGTLALSTASQAGLAGLLSQLAGAGLGVDWLREHPAALEKVTVDDVLEAGARWFAPSALTPVLVGDTAVVEDSLRTLVELETA